MYNVYSLIVGAAITNYLFNVTRVQNSSKREYQCEQVLKIQFDNLNQSNNRSFSRINFRYKSEVYELERQNKLIVTTEN